MDLLVDPVELAPLEEPFQLVILGMAALWAATTAGSRCVPPIPRWRHVEAYHHSTTQPGVSLEIDVQVNRHVAGKVVVVVATGPARR